MSVLFSLSVLFPHIETRLRAFASIIYFPFSKYKIPNENCLEVEGRSGLLSGDGMGAIFCTNLALCLFSFGVIILLISSAVG